VFVFSGLVQNTEVQLDCTHIRIGMLKGTPVGQIRVMTDQSSGIYFKLNSKWTGQHHDDTCWSSGQISWSAHSRLP